MTKAELVNKISQDTGIGKVEVLQIVESLMEVIIDSVSSKENVYLRGFGSFIVQTRAAKTARNITKNTQITIPERQVPVFKPSSEFKAQLEKK